MINNTKLLALYMLLLTFGILSISLAQLSPFVFTALYIVPGLYALDYLYSMINPSLSKIFTNLTICSVILSLLAFLKSDVNQSLVAMLENLLIKSSLIILSFLIFTWTVLTIKNSKPNHPLMVQVYGLSLYTVLMLTAFSLFQNEILFHFINVITSFMILSSLNTMVFFIFDKYLLRTRKLFITPTVMTIFGMLVSISITLFSESNNIYLKQFLLIYETVIIILITVNVLNVILINFRELSKVANNYLNYIFGIAVLALTLNFILENVLDFQQTNISFNFFNIVGGEIWCALYCFIIRTTKSKNRLLQFSFLLSILVIFSSVSRKVLLVGSNISPINRFYEFYIDYFTIAFLISTIAIILMAIITLCKIMKTIISKNNIDNIVSNH